MYVLSSHIIAKEKDLPGKVANPGRGQAGK